MAGRGARRPPDEPQMPHIRRLGHRRDHRRTGPARRKPSACRLPHTSATVPCYEAPVADGTQRRRGLILDREPTGYGFARSATAQSANAGVLIAEVEAKPLPLEPHIAESSASGAGRAGRPRGGLRDRHRRHPLRAGGRPVHGLDRAPRARPRAASVRARGGLPAEFRYRRRHRASLRRRLVRPRLLDTA